MIPADILKAATTTVSKISSLMEDAPTLGAAATEVIAEALMAERARADRIEAALLESVTNNFWDAYHYGIENDDRWWHGAVSDAEWLTRELELPSGWNDKAIVQAMITGAIDRFIERIRSGEHP